MNAGNRSVTGTLGEYAKWTGEYCIHKTGYVPIRRNTGIGAANSGDIGVDEMFGKTLEIIRGGAGIIVKKDKHITFSDSGGFIPLSARLVTTGQYDLQTISRPIKAIHIIKSKGPLVVWPNRDNDRKERFALLIIVHIIVLRLLNPGFPIFNWRIWD